MNAWQGELERECELLYSAQGQIEVKFIITP